jgi:hybrid polyketide synthase / nonribosomal peptide synthetase ACE1
MSLETFQAVTKPKVEGTLNLNEIFGQKKLQFFIAFSSLAATTGNSGQSAYSAANMFMKGLVAERRNRGLAGSIIDMSLVVGVGYVERQRKGSGMTPKQLDRILASTMAISEPDLRQVFAEAVLASSPDSGRNFEVVAGIRHVSRREAYRVYWILDPKFSHFIRSFNEAGEEKDEKRSETDAMTQALSAKSVGKALEIIKSKLISLL